MESLLEESKSEMHARVRTCRLLSSKPSANLRDQHHAKQFDTVDESAWNARQFLRMATRFAFDKLFKFYLQFSSVSPFLYFYIYQKKFKFFIIFCSILLRAFLIYSTIEFHLSVII